MHKRVQLILPFVVPLCGLLAYISSFSGTFILDDNRHIANSKTIQDIGSYIQNSSRPLVALSFHWNYLWCGVDPTGYHAVNVLIHLCAGLLLYGIVRRTLESPRLASRYAAFSRLIAVFAAALWTVHPIQTESVTYIVQRAESMMGLFYLLTLYCFIRGIGARRTGVWFSGAVLACALGMASKAVMATAPLVVLLYDRTFFAESSWRALRQRWHGYAGLAVTWLILAYLVLTPNESSGSTGLSLSAITPLGYLATQPGVICHYLKLIFWPKDLCLDYAWPPALTAGHVVGPALLVGLLVLLSVVLTWKRVPAGFCLAWFFITLAPSSSLIPIADYAFEHRLYVPLAGVTTLVAAAVVVAIARWPARFRAGLPAVAVSSVLGAIVVAALIVRTVERNRDYASFIRMASEIVRVSPHNFRARTMLIDARMGALDFGAAEEESLRLIADIQNAAKEGGRLYSTSAASPRSFLPKANNMAGVALLCQNRNDQALPFFARALALNPGFEKARYNLAVTLLGLHRLDEAWGQAMMSIERSPDSSKAYVLAGLILGQEGKRAEAKPYLERAVALDDRNMIAKLELAWLLATAPDPALRDGPRAVELAEDVCRRTGGGNARSLDVLASAYAECGDFERAARIALKALEMARGAVASGHDADPERRLSTIQSTPPDIEARLQSYRKQEAWHP